MPKRKMSQDEIGQKVSESAELLKKMWKYAPYIGGLCTVIGGIGGFAIGAYKYDANIVKQPQFSRAEIRAEKRDSVLNAKIDTNYNKLNSRIDKIRFTKVIRRNGKFIEVE